MLAKMIIALIGIQHIGFLVLEMFFWNSPTGHKVFKLDPQFARQSASLAANQGLYNGFLAAGLFWSLFQPNQAFADQLQIFFLLCVIIAGLYGGYSTSKNIYFLQALPGVAGLIAVIQRLI